ncbi:hypothetical protein AB1Y20_022889 [Prymnesium parvum]|uniref:Glyceraldehyde 3-phosphate dehydrogenase NAD(P) binding domain-containing protein n=1 Tax=Prymnesium parvum TaxID=97485 RepID=A0AB34JDE4_PRYPA
MAEGSLSAEPQESDFKPASERYGSRAKQRGQLSRAERAEALRKLQESNQLGLKKHFVLERKEDLSRVLVGINGFGRLGRMVARAISRHAEVDVVHINEPYSDLDYMAFMYSNEADRANDTGPRYSVRCTDGEDLLFMRNRPITVTRAREPSAIPWESSSVQYVIDCTGLFTTKAVANAHLRGSVRHVFIAGPSQDAFPLIKGVSELTTSEAVISNGPRAAHGAGLLISTLHHTFGVEAAAITVIHAGAGERGNAYGMGEKTRIDPSGTGFRSCHEGRLDIIPTWSGVAPMLASALPSLHGRLSSICFDTPAFNVSVLDVTCELTAKTSLSQIAEVIRASTPCMAGQISVRDDEVEPDSIRNDPCSCVFDLRSSIQLSSSFYKLVAWWDNDWPYCCRLVELMVDLHAIHRRAALEQETQEQMLPESVGT